MQEPRHSWTDPRFSVAEIEPCKTVLIGDFGPGSDAPIALDFRSSLNQPEVIRLQWGKEHENHWIKVAPTFLQFATELGLHTRRTAKKD